MSSPSPEQKNPYKGSPPRPWVRLQLTDVVGFAQEFDLLVDTGNPYPVIVAMSALRRFRHQFASDRSTNYGLLEGGWLRVSIPQLGFDQGVLGYGSDAVVRATQASSSDFEGLAGLPLLRMLEYGGNADWFWLRPSASTP